MNIFKTCYIIIPLLIESVFACAACYGDPSSSAGKGMDMAIITLLGIIGPILLAIFIGIVSIGLKSKRINHNLTQK